MSASKLVRPSVEYQDSFLAALREYHEEGHYLYNNIAELRADFKGFVKALRTEKGYPHQPYQEWVEPVPETVTWLVKDGEYLGTADIRHRLNWHLEKWGGHIHFIVRPSKRRMGYGRKILLKAMPIANYLGIETALLTVGPDNQAAIRIIEACGAQFSDELPSTNQFPARRRYWLDCT
ncbi:MAG: GNAT family N-acetyltransferase [Rhodospirillales bacterium]|nr:GNAT family N-acetyltransferase [Rhodospirillales bacterium]MCB9995281.1 GNAT family N-acetyltransferase [Rhodospirillales bacterium]